MNSLDLEALHTPKAERQLKIREEPRFSRCTVFTTTVILASATYFIAIGAWKIDKCAAEPRMPIWMIVVGAFIFLERATALKFEFAKLKFKKGHPKPNEEDFEAMKTFSEENKKFQIRPLAVDLLWLLLLIYAIFGAIWLKSVPSDSCDKLIYFPSAVYCVILLFPSFMGILCVCTFCFCKQISCSCCCCGNGLTER